MTEKADIAAMDPLGCLRLFELKNKRAQEKELIGQALSYSLAEIQMGDLRWQEELAGQLPDFESRFAVYHEGFLLNERVKGMGHKALRADFSESAWRSYNRFEQNKFRVEELRRRRQENGCLDIKINDYSNLFLRVFGISPQQLDLGDAQSASRVLLQKRNIQLTRRSIEVVMVAPGITVPEKSNLSGILTERKVPMLLVDGELRRESHNGVTTRALLRWEEKYRQINSVNRRLMIGFKRKVEALCPDAAKFRWHSDWGKHEGVYWNDDYFHLLINFQKGLIYTGSHWLTEGLKDLVPKRKAGLKKVLQLTIPDITPYGSSGNLQAPFIEGNLDAAARLTVEYYKLKEVLQPIISNWASK